MPELDEMIGSLRRIVTANAQNGRSHILLDDAPSAHFRSGDLGGLHEIWTDKASGPLDGKATEDLGQGDAVLSPPSGGVKIRWFSIAPAPPGAPEEMVRELTRQAFVAMGAGDHQPDTSRHPGMHQTHTLDAIILLRGRVRLILDDDEAVIGPGDVVIQRATNHAWAVEGDEPALFVAVLIDRS